MVSSYMGDLLRMRFEVIDLNTGKYPDICVIALKEEWQKI